jgi:hypothetical protein
VRCRRGFLSRSRWLLHFSGSIQVEKGQTSAAKGDDQFGRDFDLGKLESSATGGEIGNSGAYKVGQDEGSLSVVWSCGKVEGQSAVFVVGEGKEH